MKECIKKNKCGCGLDLAVIPASLGDDTGPMKPYNGAYQDTLVKYEANKHLWLYSHDGVPTYFEGGEGGTDDFDELINRPMYADEPMTSETNIPSVSAETTARQEADNSLQQQIDALAASSDVTDIVGTYAALQAYDTSKLKDNDIIKVLQDETHDDETTYYRWSTSTETFTLIGEEGPYYTKSATDALLADKQDKLTAGANITIDANNEISATDTTYTHFTGATASTDGVAGLVPAPVAGDENKTLKGDGTWGNVSSQTIFYANLSETGTTRHIYKDASFATTASAQDIIDANNEGQVILRGTSLANPTAYNDSYLQNSFIMPHNNDFEFVFLDRDARYEYSVSTVSDSAFYYTTSEIQPKLTAGTNINISGTTISATDTTYNDFIGTDGTATGTAGLVPAPLATDAGKFLKSDGTWDTVAAGPTVVQTTGTSTTDVMSQVATTQMVYPEGAETSHEKIGIGKIIPAGTGSSYRQKNNSIILNAGGSQISRTDLFESNSIYIGMNNFSSTAVKARSIAIGCQVSATADGGQGFVAIGFQAGQDGYVSIDGAVVIGEQAKSTVQNAVVLGKSAKANHLGSVALGANSVTTRTSEVSVANATGTRYVARVRTPALDTDAANKLYVDTKVVAYTPSEFNTLWEDA